MHGSNWIEWVAGNPRPMSSCGPFALGSLSFWTRCNHPHRRLPFRGVSCDLGGSRYGFAPKSPPKQVVYHHFRLFKWPFGGFTIFRHTQYLSYMLHTYDCLWLSIDVCTSVQYMCDFCIRVPGSSSSAQNDQASSEIGLRIWAPKLQPQGQQQKWSKDLGETNESSGPPKRKMRDSQKTGATSSTQRTWTAWTLMNQHCG